MTAPTSSTVPTITSISDLSNSQLVQQVATWSKLNPLKDHIYEFIFKPFDLERKSSPANANCDNWCIAGSSALHQVVKTHSTIFKLDSFSKLPPSDTDIFFLNSKGPHRYKIGATDIVHTLEKSVSDLLLNFDLPCCRAAVNSRFDVWISIHCLNSLFQGTYYLPEYCRNKDQFCKILDSNRKGTSNLNTGPESVLFARLTERIAKYQKRGFTANFVDTGHVLRWIRNRFTYAEWSFDDSNEEPLAIVFKSVQFDKTAFGVEMTVNGIQTSCKLITNIDFDVETVTKIVSNRIRQNKDKILLDLVKTDATLPDITLVTL